MAVRFDAAGDRLQITANLPDYNGNYTWIVWASRSSGTLDVILDIGSSTASMDHFGFINSTGNLFMETDGGSGGYGYVQDAVARSTDTWYFFALRRSSATLLELLAGSLTVAPAVVLTLTQSNATRAAANSLHFSEDATPAYGFNGKVGPALFFTRALSDGEVTAQANAIRPLDTTNLYGWWPMFPGSGERTLDYSGNGNNLSENGTLTDEAPPPVGWGAPTGFWSVSAAAPPAGNPWYAYAQM